MRLAFLSALLFLCRVSFAQTNDAAPVPDAPSGLATPKPAAVSTNIKPASTGKSSRSGSTAQMQATIEQLTQSNRDLLDLLKQQQAVLEDIQFDRRQQSRHIQSVEERLEQALLENAQLQGKVAKLESDAAVRPTLPVQPAPEGGAVPADTNTPPANSALPPPVVETPPPPPASYLPPPESEGPAGTKSWHRLLTLKGEDGQQSDMFHIQGRTWRVLWHNQDKPGKAYANTSGLFINAFPKDDTIPQKVCAKLGTGGDSADLDGPGNYYLKVDASGGSWELAVEDLY